MSRQANSDPLPYVQVDRAVKPRAALLAGALGVTNQHALGSLVEWWDLNGDPRELERIIEATPEGQEPAVIVSPEDAAMRFRLASGKDVEPIALVHLGLLEPVGGKFRVRGMSRYFAPVEARIRARRAASAGGKASVESRRKSRGTAQPTVRESFDAPFDVRFESASSAVRTTPEATPKQSRSDAEAESNPIGQRSAVSVQRQVEDSAPHDAAPPRKRRQKPDKPPDPRHAPLVAELVAVFEAVRGAKYPFTGRDAKAVSEMLATGQPEALLRAWERALRHTGFPVTSTLAELQKNLAHFIGDAPAGRGPVAAESVDWGQVQLGDVPL